MWLLSNNAILTKDNLIRRKWSGNPKCQFCNFDETCDHLFFTCSVAKVIWAVVAICIGADNIPVSLNQCWAWCGRWLPHGKKFLLWGVSAICWAIWKARNRACFDGKIIRNPIEIICHAGALMRFWTGLFLEMDRAMLIDGANTMLKVATEIFISQSTTGGRMKRLKSIRRTILRIPEARCVQSPRSLHEICSG